MKQLLLRVDDELHARLSERAKREHRSVNSIANEILNLAHPDDSRTAVERIKARAAALGLLAAPLPAPVDSKYADMDIDELREKAIDSMRGVGPILDSIIDEDRGRLDRLCRFLAAGERLSP